MKTQPTEKTNTIGLPSSLVARIKLHCVTNGLLIRAWATKVLEAALNKENK